MRILALDLATATGWACGEHDEHPYASGVESFARRSSEHQGAQFYRFHTWLSQRLYIGHVDALIAEAPLAFGGVGQDRLRLAYGFAAIAMSLAVSTNTRWLSSIAPSSLKKWTTHNGAAKKPQMLAAVSAQWGAWKTPSAPIVDDNEADAIALLHYARSTHALPPALAKGTRHA